MIDQPRYDRIGHGYAGTRREDPRFAALIHAALGDARSVVNVGAGAGSYEPRDRHVVAIEPSDVMAAQRPRELAPALRVGADRLPLRDGSVDAAMAVRDWTLLSFWAHPDRVLDADARNATSGFARMPPDVVERLVAAVRLDLEDGTWDTRHGHLRRLDSFDAGLRLVINTMEPGDSSSGNSGTSSA